MEPGIILPIVCAVLPIAVLLVLGIVVLVNKIKTRSTKSKTQGVIHVDYSDPIDGPHLFLELRVPVADVVELKRVTLDVDTTKYYSHE